MLHGTVRSGLMQLLRLQAQYESDPKLLPREHAGPHTDSREKKTHTLRCLSDLFPAPAFLNLQRQLPRISAAEGCSKHFGTLCGANNTHFGVFHDCSGYFCALWGCFLLLDLPPVWGLGSWRALSGSRQSSTQHRGSLPTMAGIFPLSCIIAASVAFNCAAVEPLAAKKCTATRESN